MVKATKISEYVQLFVDSVLGIRGVEIDDRHEQVVF